MKRSNLILRVLKEAKAHIKTGNATELKILSNETTHAATISQDPDDIVVAVLIYAIGKVLERDHYKDMEGYQDFHNSITKNITLAIKHLEKNDFEKYRNHLGKIRNCLNKLDGHLKDYIKETFQKAEINKAFKLYENGLSSEATANLLGISLWDLASYIGQSSISNASVSMSMPIKKRIKIAEDIFS